MLVALRHCRHRLGQINESLALLEGMGEDLARRASEEQTERLQGGYRTIWELDSDLRALAVTLDATRV